MKGKICNHTFKVTITNLGGGYPIVTPKILQEGIERQIWNFGYSTNFKIEVKELDHEIVDANPINS